MKEFKMLVSPKLSLPLYAFVSIVAATAACDGQSPPQAKQAPQSRLAGADGQENRRAAPADKIVDDDIGVKRDPPKRITYGENPNQDPSGPGPDKNPAQSTQTPSDALPRPKPEPAEFPAEPDKTLPKTVPAPAPIPSTTASAGGGPSDGRRQSGAPQGAAAQAAGKATSTEPEADGARSRSGLVPEGSGENSSSPESNPTDEQGDSPNGGRKGQENTTLRKRLREVLLLALSESHRGEAQSEELQPLIKIKAGQPGELRCLIFDNLPSTFKKRPLIFRSNPNKKSTIKPFVKKDGSVNWVHFTIHAVTDREEEVECTIRVAPNEEYQRLFEPRDSDPAAGEDVELGTFNGLKVQLDRQKKETQKDD